MVFSGPRSRFTAFQGSIFLLQGKKFLFKDRSRSFSTFHGLVFSSKKASFIYMASQRTFKTWNSYSWRTWRIPRFHCDKDIVVSFQNRSQEMQLSYQLLLQWYFFCRTVTSEIHNLKFFQWNHSRFRTRSSKCSCCCSLQRMLHFSFSLCIWRMQAPRVALYLTLMILNPGACSHKNSVITILWNAVIFTQAKKSSLEHEQVNFCK